MSDASTGASVSTIELAPEIFGDDSPCFGCSPRHPSGLRMRFRREGDRVTTRFVPQSEHQGPPGIVHGGLGLTIADELAAWTVIGLQQRFGFTASVSAKLSRPLRIGVEIEGQGRITTENGRTTTVAVDLVQAGVRALSGEFVFVVLDERGAERVLGGPLPEAWRRFARRGAADGSDASAPRPGSIDSNSQ